MAHEAPTGFWKGLAITSTDRILIVVYFEKQGNRLIGKFEAPELAGKDSKGDLTGQVEEQKVTFESSAHDFFFSGEISGRTPKHQMIFGTIRTRRASQPSGTLTLFPRDLHHGPVADLYKGDNGT